MPIYIYKCKECSETTEILFPLEEIKCSKCGSKIMEKQISNFTAIYKGKGFTKTIKEPVDPFKEKQKRLKKKQDKNNANNVRGTAM